ncbi:FAD binding domain-containing protein [Durotheca rogersii]|uniref:FAD binding domain-containing protein n=1 Tax=Durotheca rogersii TaxID=419775 RepID=UPI00221EC8FC|nr:FAD binding domain-containing protein [Durotheca rogersii]KAI5857322.1 FAD binding domain-containing protein [Durotheca rogersii]
MLRTWITVAATLGGLPVTSARRAQGRASGVPACDALRDVGLGDRLLFPGDPRFEPEIETWPAENARLRPYCLVLPHNKEEVSTALKALVSINDGAGDWHIAVRSGGHSYPGSNGIERGVTIDLSQMNSSRYDPTSNLASIEPGARWRDVYANLDSNGVVVTGGRDGSVGVGGFLLGGGMSYFTGKMGFGCDSIVNYEVVLADGTIVNANRNTNADLWRALKGGGNNFGIVTRFDIEAIPTRDLFYDVRTMSYEHTDAVVETVVGFANQEQSLSANHLVTYYSFEPRDRPDIIVNTIYVNVEGDGESPTPFDKLRALPALTNSTVLQTMAEASAGGGVGTGTRNAASTLSFKNDPELIRRVIELHTEFVETLKKYLAPEKFQSGIFLQPIPPYLAEIGKQRGGNMLGLDRVSEGIIMWTGGVGIVDGTDQDFAVAQAELHALTAQVKELSQSLGGDKEFVYLNYAYGFQDPVGSYGAENIQHIRDVAAKYDPTGVFQKRIPGGFKISRVR